MSNENIKTGDEVSVFGLDGSGSVQVARVVHVTDTTVEIDLTRDAPGWLRAEWNYSPDPRAGYLKFSKKDGMVIPKARHKEWMLYVDTVPYMRK